MQFRHRQCLVHIARQAATQRKSIVFAKNYVPPDMLADQYQ